MTKAIRVLLVSVLLGTAMMAVAQDQVRVQVPFGFHLEGQVLPAGEYSVQRVFDRDNLVLRIHGAQGQNSISFLVNTASDETGSSFSFRRYGDDYFLIGVKTPSGKFTLPKSREERTMSVNSSGTDVIVGSK